MHSAPAPNNVGYCLNSDHPVVDEQSQTASRETSSIRVGSPALLVRVGGWNFYDQLRALTMNGDEQTLADSHQP
jgi:ABC-type nickel/cobalt efflux system permease component RcnA